VGAEHNIPGREGETVFASLNNAVHVLVGPEEEGLRGQVSIAGKEEVCGRDMVDDMIWRVTRGRVDVAWDGVLSSGICDERPEGFKLLRE